MIVDSTALPEQAVRDIVGSAFQSAGQRCSALRILYIQREVEERILEMLFGAMDALRIGDPWDLATDIGPVIDGEAQSRIEAHCARAEQEGRVLKRLAAPGAGRFVPPTVLRVEGIEALEEEIFGPVLHVATFGADEIDVVVDAVNRAGYGLTFGLHTRIDDRVQHIVDRVRAGNIYVNRNQIGAVVGSQPFGGEGLSGTGPKAGGPHYVRRLMVGAAPAGGRPSGAVISEALLAAAINDAGRALAARAYRGNGGPLRTRWTCPARPGNPTGSRSRRAAWCSASAPAPMRYARRSRQPAKREMPWWQSPTARVRRSPLTPPIPSWSCSTAEVAPDALTTLSGIAAVACSRGSRRACRDARRARPARLARSCR